MRRTGTNIPNPTDNDIFGVTTASGGLKAGTFADTHDGAVS
jgi:hypothetical protein